MSASTAWLLAMTVLIMVGMTYGVVSNARFLRRARSGRFHEIKVEQRATQVHERLMQGFLYATFFCAAMLVWSL